MSSQHDLATCMLDGYIQSMIDPQCSAIAVKASANTAILIFRTPRTANQCRALLIDIFNHAASKGLCPDNPAASTINRIEKKQRKRHTIEGLKAIREKSPAWLQNAIDLA